MLSTSISLVALDMDGTLLNSDKTISEANRQALARCQQRGISIVLASGRRTKCLERYAEQIGLDCYLLGYNGGRCISTLNTGRKTLHEKGLLPDEFNKLIDFVQKRKFFLNVYLADGVCCVRDEEFKKISDEYARLGNFSYQYVDSYDDLRHTQPLKASIVFMTTNERNELYEEIRAEGNFHRFHLSKTFTEIAPVRLDMLEFMHQEVNKGSGIISLCEALEISVENVLALGDADNDIELLQVAGMGICMAQGTQAAKQAANRVSTWTNDEDGVAREILAHLTDLTDLGATHQ